MKSLVQKIGWMALDAVVILAAVLLLRTFVVSPFSVDGESMTSTLHDGDLILIDKISKSFREPERGDIIVFYPPIEKYTNQQGLLCLGKKTIAFLQRSELSTACKARDFFVKRVIGIPGDTVEIWNGDVFVTPKGGSQVRVQDDFLDVKNKGHTCVPATSCGQEQSRRKIFPEVPEGSVFVLGDNRLGSSDSRAWREGNHIIPFVPKENIAGTVRLVFWPPSDMSWFSGKNILEE